MKLAGSRSISFAPFFEDFRGYRFFDFKNDLTAALAVALLTIPQSIAYSLLAGLPPTAGIFSAIFGTIFCSFFGGSSYLVSGPSTGTAILIQTSIAEILGAYYEHAVGAEKEQIVLHILTQMVILIGLIQIAAAFFNVAKLLQFVSRPVTLGYFAGITVAIFATQVFYFTGISLQPASESVLGKLFFFFSHLLQLHFPSFLLGLFSLGSLLFFRRTFQKAPDALFMLILASLLVYAIEYFGGGDTFLRLKSLQRVDHPTPDLIFPLLDFTLLNRVFPAASAIALLAILEVFSISRNVSSQTKTTLKVNQDVFGLGIANTVLSFISGALPASGSVTRTSLNLRTGGTTRLAPMGSAFLMAALLFFGWPLVEYIPLAALAALLIATLPTLMNFQEIRLCFRATREDAAVFLTTFASCLIFSLDLAFFIGIIISIASYLRKSAVPHLVEYAFNSKGRLIIVRPKEDMHRKVRIIGISGELYFASADFFQSALQPVVEDPKTLAIVLRLNNIYHMDASMCLAILKLYETLQETNRYLVISGLTEEVWHVFHRAGLVKQIGMDNLYFTDESNPQFSTWKACLRAQELLYS